MKHLLTPCAFAVAVSALLAGCGEAARLPHEAGTGPQPELPLPRKTLLPTVNIAPASAWPDGTMPVGAEQRRRLLSEGISIDGDRVDLDDARLPVPPGQAF